MKRILILGAGLSSSSLISYLLDHSDKNQWKVVLGDISMELAEKKINNHPNGKPIKFDIFDEQQRDNEISEADLVISMLPARMHFMAAEACVRLGKNMITASYVSDDIRKLDEEAKKKGLLLLNEIGVDPGIDHMSAMQIIDRIKASGGVLKSFKSSTGGLVAPQHDNNPWNYKFTWNPRNVVLAGQGASKFLDNGRYKYIPYHKLFERTENINVLDMGEFEVYANRDSLHYKDIYGLEDIETLFRGTMRRPGFSKAWNVFVQLGMTDDSYKVHDSLNITYRDFINSYLEYHKTQDVPTKLSRYLGIEKDCEVMKKLEWLGIFESTKVDLPNASPAQILQRLLESKWSLEPGDKDMIVMQHLFQYELNNTTRQIKSSMVVKGIDTVHTAMSITVGTPIAIAAELILNGEINDVGVKIPINKGIYEPVLKKLENYGIKFVEEKTTGDLPL